MEAAMNPIQTRAVLALSLVLLGCESAARAAAVVRAAGPRGGLATVSAHEAARLKDGLPFFGPSAAATPMLTAVLENLDSRRTDHRLYFAPLLEAHRQVGAAGKEGALARAAAIVGEELEAASREAARLDAGPAGVALAVGRLERLRRLVPLYRPELGSRLADSYRQARGRQAALRKDQLHQEMMNAVALFGEGGAEGLAAEPVEEPAPADLATRVVQPLLDRLAGPWRPGRERLLARLEALGRASADPAIKGMIQRQLLQALAGDLGARSKARVIASLAAVALTDSAESQRVVLGALSRELGRLAGRPHGAESDAAYAEDVLDAIVLIGRSLRASNAFEGPDPLVQAYTAAVPGDALHALIREKHRALWSHGPAREESPGGRRAYRQGLRNLAGRLHLLGADFGDAVRRLARDGARTTDLPLQLVIVDGLGRETVRSAELMDRGAAGARALESIGLATISEDVRKAVVLSVIQALKSQPAPSVAAELVRAIVSVANASGPQLRELAARELELAAQGGREAVVSAVASGRPGLTVDAQAPELPAPAAAAPKKTWLQRAGARLWRLLVALSGAPQRAFALTGEAGVLTLTR
ncbi:MAG: hypothetical protein HY554_13265 [Elusimicrobia bacterium]|nr:hypothetical protein [Elusimicrobiota bacterium]